MSYRRHAVHSQQLPRTVSDTSGEEKKQSEELIKMNNQLDENLQTVYQNSYRLSMAERKQLEKFIHTGPKEFKLLYSFTQNGADSSIFHQRCDNKGPTITVIYDTVGTIFGGYTEKSWTESGSHSRDEHAFLFRLQQNGKTAPVKFPIKSPDKAIYCHKSYGPVFGGGYDLSTFNGSFTAQNDEFTLNSDYNFGHSYDMGGISTDQLTSKIKTVTEIEVFSVTESVLAPVWREMVGWEQQDLEELKNEMDSWSPPHGVGLQSANILFLGPVGAGKSSFFNTIASVFRGHVTGQAVCGSAEQSITSKYHMYRVRGSALSKPLKFKLCDTRGIEENQGIEGTELNYLLEGNVPNGYQFNPSTPISPGITGFVSSPTMSSKIHCVCFIIDGSTAAVMSEKTLEKIKSLQTKVRQKGLPQVVLVTKIDKVCSHVEEDVSAVFQSVAIQELVDKVSDILGVPRGHVLPVKNYEKELDVTNHVSILALLSLRQILRATEDFMFNLLDILDDEKKNSESLE